MKILSVTEPDQEFGQHKHDCRLGEFMWVLAPAFPNSDFVADVAATASAENRKYPHSNIGVLLIKTRVRLSGLGEKIHERA